VSLGGSGYAALTVSGRNIKNESITGKDVKRGSLTGSDVKRDSLGGNQVKESSLGKVKSARSADSVGVAANAAALGGAPAESYAKRLFAVVDGTPATPTVVRSSGGVKVTRIGADNQGDYTVTFPQAVSQCAYSVTTGDAGNGEQVVEFFVDASKDEGNANGVDVSVVDTGHKVTDFDGDFSLIVIC
jgi:hypothetical protein